MEIIGLGRQLTLGLSLRDDATFSNFYSGNNQALVAHLQNFSHGGGEPFIYLWGAPGTGRTHLLQASCHGAANAIYLDLTEPALQPEILLNIENLPLICIDNIESAAGQPPWEMALFNLYNSAREKQTRLLIAACAPPGQLPWRLADLESRFSGGLVLNLCPLADEEKLLAMQIWAKRRGLALTAEIGNFLLHHYSRQTGDLFIALEKLDQESMTAKRRLTIPFIKQILNL
jgi:DnaA-homolog protein